MVWYLGGLSSGETCATVDFTTARQTRRDVTQLEQGNWRLHRIWIALVLDGSTSASMAGYLPNPTIMTLERREEQKRLA